MKLGQVGQGHLQSAAILRGNQLQIDRLLKKRQIAASTPAVIARGEMPEGLTAQDLTNMGLPLPGEIEITQEPDGTVIYRQKAPSKRARNAFVCDSPGDE